MREVIRRMFKGPDSPLAGAFHTGGIIRTEHGKTAPFLRGGEHVILNTKEEEANGKDSN